MPSDFAASIWPGSIDEDPGAHDLGHVGALVEAEGEDAGLDRARDHEAEMLMSGQPKMWVTPRPK